MCRKKQAKTAPQTAPPPAPLFGQGPLPQPKPQPKLRPRRKKQDPLAAVAASSSGGRLAAAGLAAGKQTERSWPQVREAPPRGTKSLEEEPRSDAEKQ